MKDNLFTLPPLFRLIRQESGTGWEEMYRVFNMGHRMEIYVPAGFADNIIQVSKQFDVEAQIIGFCKKAKGRRVFIESEFGSFTY